MAEVVEVHAPLDLNENQIREAIRNYVHNFMTIHHGVGPTRSNVAAHFRVNPYYFPDNFTNDHVTRMLDTNLLHPQGPSRLRVRSFWRTLRTICSNIFFIIICGLFSFAVCHICLYFSNYGSFRSRSPDFQTSAAETGLCPHLELNSFRLSIQTLEGDSYVILVQPSDTIFQVKLKVQRITGISFERMNLIYRGVVLSNNLCLLDYNITEEVIFTLTLKQRGGKLVTENKTLTAEMSSDKPISPGEACSQCDESTVPRNECEESIVSRRDCDENTVPRSDCDESTRYETPSSLCNLALSEIASSASVSSIPPFPEYYMKTNVELSELKNKLAQLIKSRGPDLIQACKNFDRRATGVIPKTQLRQVIRMFCFLISAAQFDSLCQEFHLMESGKINYSKFFSKLSGSKIEKTQKTYEKIPSNLPIDEVELRIQEKIRKNLRDIIRSFWLFDINKDGFIQKAELRRIIRNYCFDLNDATFNDLWKSYDPKGTGIVNYRDFLVKLGISADRYKKYMPQEAAYNAISGIDDVAKDATVKRSCDQKSKRAALENRDDPAIQGLPLDEIVLLFINRLRMRYGLLLDVFKVFDYQNNGEISSADFRGVVNLYVMPMSSILFNRVFKKLDMDLTDLNLDYHAFLKRFCKSSRDDVLPSRDSEKLDCTPIIQQIKNRVLNPEARLKSVFTKINLDDEWQVTRPELRRAVEMGLNFKLTDDEFKELTMILDPGNTNIIKCLHFIKLFEGPCDADCLNNDEASNTSNKMDLEKYKNLRGDKLISKLKHHLNKNMDIIEKAILVCDPDRSGFIVSDKLKVILSGFCFPLSKDQFQEIIEDVRKYGDDINYHEFLKKLKKKPDEDTEKWIDTVNKLVTYKSRCPPELDVTEAEEMLRDCVRSRKTGMLNDFKTLDVCNVGVACKDDARNILSKFAFRFNDEQFNKIWEGLPLNKYGQLLYDKFLEEYSTSKDTEINTGSEGGSVKEMVEDINNLNNKQDVIVSEPVESQEFKRDVTTKTAESRKTAKEIFFSRAPHLKQVFNRMEPTIVRNLKSIKFHLRRADPKVTDTVDFVTLKSILAKSGIYFSKDDEFGILEHFDVNLKGKINYRDFLNIFVWYN